MTADLQLILHRDTDGKHKLWACRGAGKGCRPNKFRRNKVPCADCFGPLPGDMTMGEVKDRIEMGDA